MHTANHYYGHAHLFADYVGIPFPVIIDGYLQHGWNLHDGFAVGTGFVPGAKLFVWSESVLRRGWAMGRRNYHVIGSAWAYLLEMEAAAAAVAMPAPDPATERSGTIFYPFHGWEGQEVAGDHAAMLRRLQEVETEPLTVCLYWVEHRNDAIRAVYEDAGCRVITHGMRGFAYQGTDRDFLRKQYRELSTHKRVVSNRLGSAILYGASVGCEVGVYGDPMILENEDPVYGGIERQKRNWPELHQEFVPRDCVEPLAEAELGLRQVREPAEIMSLFGWTRPVSQLAAPA
ncbi:MAG TPA: hypothetical protein VHZ06_00165 [Marmoricola sp.]|nr:hypothetical protein [Marmoricola sp.]